MELYNKDALISAIKTSKKQISFLVGSPMSVDATGKGVPGVSSMLEIIREVVQLEIPSELQRYDDAIRAKSGTSAYQTAMGWLQANVNQDAVNMVIRRAVIKSCLQVSTVGDLTNPTSDGEPEHWFITPGTKDLGLLTCCKDSRFHGPIITPNFDPLISLAIRAAGGRPSLKVLDSDGSLPKDVEIDPDVRNVVHLHGFWRGSDTLHTPSQLRNQRPKLKASLQRLLRNHVLVVVAYGGWDDIFTSSLSDLLLDDQAELEVIWCFRESNVAIVKHEYASLLTSVSQAISRGRFRCYADINCETIFNEIINRLDLQIPPPPVRIGNCHGTQIAYDQKLDFVDRYLTKRLDEALLSFCSQPKVWVEPNVRKSAEVAKDAETAEKIDLTSLISTPLSAVIKAPPQFGLTCLALFLTREAWRHNSSLWIYLDSKNLKPNSASIDQAFTTEVQFMGGVRENVKCIILDSWNIQDKDAIKLVKKLSEHFIDIPIIIMETIDSTLFVQNEPKFDREFEAMYLWALPRGHVRKVVSEYNEIRHIGDEDKVTTKVVSDLEVLNLHRTPFNCITMLKVSEIDFDESPVNRSEMIKRVLFLLFNVDDIPTYKVRPDLKDCEYVLGYFCETMLRKNNFIFTREYFLEVLDRCCKERFIDLEVQVVFDVLYLNNIIVRRGHHFTFRFAFWIYYFAAQRMIHSKEFAEFIYEDMRYVNYPEILEFYTGIDRQRKDALEVLIKDINAACEQVQNKSGIPDGLNPYKFGQWSSSDALVSQMEDEIRDGVKDSNLPASVKDHFADRGYDRSRPYNQDIQNFLNDFSYVQMAQAMKAAARALRNSDYVDPDIKVQLLNGIMKCWGQASKILLILAPILAAKGHAAFDGAGFWLVGDFGDTVETKFATILNEIPANVVHWFEEDLFSQKMGPLLINELNNASNPIVKHELVLILINQRPRGWKAQVQNYVSEIKHNSFYLWDVYRTLRAQYRYSYATPRTLSEIEYLIKMSAAKHVTGSKSPSMTLINKVTDAIPAREVKEEIA
ncbi:uncharacterized protein GPEL0_01f3997 [Geoanaerobacter pelophilus]|uniref:SIR2-like domain-containing protein n=1 Tax=Geoanaerobacter pelophilus TaxID=60036 RepID=A0ABQ0MNS9_9BACT|nr:SIR2 family protein [Geoanaerobacter pelophilus]GAW67906.1 uncharacterized protein GPEL0_01f3997 [Geoanaerobacter pelophilus]